MKPTAFATWTRVFPLHHKCALVGSAILAISVLATTAFARDWLRFRGPNGSGVAVESDVCLRFGPGENVRWRSPLPGPGNSGPIVVGNRVFVTCATDEGRRRSLYCLDRMTGQSRWVRMVTFQDEEPTHRTNPYCGSSPASDGQRVVAWHSSAGLHCYDLTGEELWRRDLGSFIHIWGYGASPVFHCGKVLLNAGPGERTFLIALDAETGETLWRTEEAGGLSGLVDVDPDNRRASWKGSWSTPVVAGPVGSEIVLVSYPSHVVAYDFDSGDVLWRLEGLGQLIYTSVLVDGNVGVAMSRRSMPAMGFRLDVPADASQDERMLWIDSSNNPQRIGSGVIVGGHIYLINETGVAQCLNLLTGQEKWSARVPGGTHWGSLVLAGRHLMATSQKGTTVVFLPDPTGLDIVSVNELDEPSNSTPAISGDQVFLRTFEAVYCIEESQAKAGEHEGMSGAKQLPAEPRPQSPRRTESSLDTGGEQLSVFCGSCID